MYTIIFFFFQKDTDNQIFRKVGHQFYLQIKHLFKHYHQKIIYFSGKNVQNDYQRDLFPDSKQISFQHNE